jgi:AraC family transcriptional regulator of adaptative response / DNA-3-methyladenine glycosylase II
LTWAKVKSIQFISRNIAAKSLDLDSLFLKDKSVVEAALLQLPGIGPWTAKYVLMRVFADPDAFPASDLGVLKAMKTKSAIAAEIRSHAWRPWRSYAVLHLWNSLSSGKNRENSAC